jgi:predicted nucleic acid-binding protein
MSGSPRGAAHSYGQVIAAIAHANGLDLYTRNPDDFVGLDELVTMFTV